MTRYPTDEPRLLRRLPEVRVHALHVLLCDGDAARHGRPVRLHADPPAQVRAQPSLGVLDYLNRRKLGGRMEMNNKSKADGD